MWRKRTSDTSRFHSAQQFNKEEQDLYDSYQKVNVERWLKLRLT